MSTARFCKKCNNPIKTNAKYCTKCGTEYTETRNRCINPECKLYDKPAALVESYCAECGKPLSGPEKPEDQTVRVNLGNL